MLATFSIKMERLCGVPPSFLLRCFFEPIFFRIFGPRGRWGTPFLAPKSDGVPHFCSIFGPNLIPTWRHLGATLVQEVVLDGLVGLREAQRITVGLGPLLSRCETTHETLKLARML